MGDTGKRRIAILGGGVSSITTAFALTATEELRDRYEITVHQLGWRLGGKGASGRNAAYGQRIEEHGLHIWLGFYDNAFRLMRECYEELDRPAGAPLATFDEAFHPLRNVILCDHFDGKIVPQYFKVPGNDGVPGTGGVLPTIWELLEMFASGFRELLSDLLRGDDQPSLPTSGAHGLHIFDRFRRVLHEVGHWVAEHLVGFEKAVEWTCLEALEALVAIHRHGAHEHRDAGDLLRLRELLETVRRWMWSVSQKHLDNHEFRVFATISDTMLTCFIGLLADEVAERGFSSLDDEEFSDWLRRHGGHEAAIQDGSLVRAIYDLCFGYAGGDVDTRCMAAGATLSGFLRMMFTYKGAFMWEMQAGMGDTIFTPYYEVLRRRGVRFEFFHAVTNLGLSEDRRRVDSIDFVEQVETTGGSYDPLVDVCDLPSWPSEPRWEQLRDGEALHRRGVDFEDEPNPLGRESSRLRRGEDFDDVVLGIAVGALPPITRELLADLGNPAFRHMIQAAATVQTQAYQVWTTPTVEELGWDYPPRSVTGTLAEPVDTYCNMTHLLPREDWPKALGVQNIAYFCGVLPDIAGETRDEADARVRANSIGHLRSQVPSLWPKTAVGEDDFNWSVLVDASGRSGEERFDAQFWRVNRSGTERYVLTPPGAVRDRLAPDESGYDNLFLTGDWVRNPLNLGCVEGATMAGQLAARAICGEGEIVGEGDPWFLPSAPPAPSAPTARARKPYVPISSRTATGPLPADCRGTKLHGFFVEGDLERLEALVRRCFDAPTGGAESWLPVTRWILLTFGDIAELRSQTPPFSTMGYLEEKQVTFWVPVARVHREGGRVIADEVSFFVPYLFVENPVSLATGREVLGYAKTWGRIGMPEAGQPPNSFTLDAFGVERFSPDAKIENHPLLEIRRTSGSALGSAYAGLRELVSAFRGQLVDWRSEGRMEPSPGLDAEIFEMLRRMEVPQIFLKQFRSIEDGTRACFQEITHAPCRVTKLRSAAPYVGEWELDLHEMESHPLASDLGLKSQTTALAFHVDMDFVLQAGRRARDRNR